MGSGSSSKSKQYKESKDDTGVAAGSGDADRSAGNSSPSGTRNSSKEHRNSSKEVRISSKNQVYESEDDHQQPRRKPSLKNVHVDPSMLHNNHVATKLCPYVAVGDEEDLRSPQPGGHENHGHHGHHKKGHHGHHGHHDGHHGHHGDHDGHHGHHGNHGHHGHHGKDGHHGHHGHGSKSDHSQPAHTVDGPDRRTGTVDDPVLKEIQETFPVDEFEMTLYASLPRYRPGETLTLQDFKEKKTLNGVKGKCIDHDGKLHVWTIMLDDGRKIRAVPKSLQKVMQDPEDINKSKAVEGYVAYGQDIVHVVLDTEHVALHREVKVHVPRPKTPPKEEKRHHEHEPKAKAKRKLKKKHTGEHHHHHQEEEEPEVKPFEVGDAVVMKDAGGARLGVGRIKELGEVKDNHRMLKVEFGQRGGVYNLEDTELEHAEDKQRRAALVH